MAAFVRFLKRQDNVAGSEVLATGCQSSHETQNAVEVDSDKINTKKKTKKDEEKPSSKDKKATKAQRVKNGISVGSSDLLIGKKRLMKEFSKLSKDAEVNCGSFSVELVEDNLYEWNIMLLSVDPESKLHEDMKDLNVSHILLNLTFPDNFPFSPPFMRVVKPRIRGGFVLDGGAICMELLTKSGWTGAYSVEAIVVQFAALVTKGNGRIDKKTTSEFSKKEAEASFKSLVKTHEKYGWVTPPASEG